MRALRKTLVPLLLVSACGANSVLEQATKLGDRDFSTESWAVATQVQRGEMTASFLRTHDATTLNRRQIESLLGRPTGYYHYDNNPAYFVGPDTVVSEHGHGYLWVFEADKDDGQIKRVFFVPEVSPARTRLSPDLQAGLSTR